MALGHMNRIVLQLHTQGQITGDGNERDIANHHVFLPCKARLAKAQVYGVVAGTGTPTSDIEVYAGGDKSAGTAVFSAAAQITSSTDNVQGTLANPGKLWPADQEFCLSEKTTSGKTLDGLTVILTFREYEA
ncbi:MAG: hypothetical protein R6U98_06610 [Pirellulaceae bacterium]